jgi:hypothetical protein
MIDRYLLATFNYFTPGAFSYGMLKLVGRAHLFFSQWCLIRQIWLENCRKIKESKKQVTCDRERNNMVVDLHRLETCRKVKESKRQVTCDRGETVWH